MALFEVREMPHGGYVLYRDGEAVGAGDRPHTLHRLAEEIRKDFLRKQAIADSIAIIEEALVDAALRGNQAGMATKVFAALADRRAKFDSQFDS
jgi:hypothetical protein